MTKCYALGCSHFSEKSDCQHFRFPQDPWLRIKWIDFCRRADVGYTDNDRICSCHFVDGNEENGPTIFSFSKPIVLNISQKRRKRKLKATVTRRVRKAAMPEDDGNAVKLENDGNGGNSAILCFPMQENDGNSAMQENGGNDGNSELHEDGGNDGNSAMPEAENDDCMIKEEYFEAADEDDHAYCHPCRTEVCAAKQKRLSDTITQLKNELDAARKELCNSKKTLNTVKKELCSSQRQLVTSRNDLLTSKMELITSRWKVQLADTSKKELDTSKRELVTSKKDLCYLKRELVTAKKKIRELENRRPRMSIQYIKDDREKMFMYTSFPYETFEVLLKTLANVPLTYYTQWRVTSISLEDQLLMVLMKLKMNAKDLDLGERFNVSRRTVTNVTHTLIPALHEVLYGGVSGGAPSGESKCEGSTSKASERMKSYAVLANISPGYQCLTTEIIQLCSCLADFQAPLRKDVVADKYETETEHASATIFINDG